MHPFTCVLCTSQKQVLKVLFLSSSIYNSDSKVRYIGIKFSVAFHFVQKYKHLSIKFSRNRKGKLLILHFQRRNLGNFRCFPLQFCASCRCFSRGCSQYFSRCFFLSSSRYSSGLTERHNSFKL